MRLKRVCLKEKANLMAIKILMMIPVVVQVQAHRAVDLKNLERKRNLCRNNLKNLLRKRLKPLLPTMMSP